MFNIMNPRKTSSIFNTPKLVKLAYYVSFTAKNITGEFSNTGKWHSDEDFAPTNVYGSNNSGNIPPNQKTSSAALEPPPSFCVPSTDINEEDLQLFSSITSELSSSLLQNLPRKCHRIWELSTSIADLHRTDD